LKSFSLVDEVLCSSSFGPSNAAVSKSRSDYIGIDPFRHGWFWAPEFAHHIFCGKKKFFGSFEFVLYVGLEGCLQSSHCPTSNL
jgi:hypothetical protein